MNDKVEIKREFKIRLTGLCKIVKMVMPELNLYEQRETVTDIWKFWKQTAPGAKGYDYFDAQFLVFLIFFLTADAEKLQQFASVASAECQAAFYRGWGVIESSRADIAEEDLKQVSSILESVMTERIGTLIDEIEDIGDEDFDPEGMENTKRVLMGLRLDGEEWLRCGDPDCPVCKRVDILQQELKEEYND